MQDITRPERLSERALREAHPDHPRAASPTGGHGHPFEGATIHLSVDWNGRVQIGGMRDGQDVPLDLNKFDENEILGLAHDLQRVVYTAQWRTTHPDEPQGETL